MTPKYWKTACVELSNECEVMRNLIKQYPGSVLQSRGNAFETLFRSIVGQQISVKAAQSVWDRTCEVVDAKSPEKVLRARTPSLRKCGLSARKVEYAKDLARHFVEGQIRPRRWKNLEDEEIIEELIAVRGIGVWTAEMFLMFHLLRPNIFPKADLGLQKAISIHYNKRYPMTARQLELFRKKFDPWSTVATWYLWRALDPIPVEY